jgi:hypothetical protein
MSAAIGTWAVAMKSPFGNQAFDLTFTDAPARGVMSSGADSQDVENLSFDGDDVTFTVDVIKPMRLHILWKLTAEGDVIDGTAKAGSFPAQKVAGVRA